MHSCAVLFDLLLTQRWPTFNKPMRRNGHDVGCTVRKPNTGSGKGDLHHVFSEITGGMHHVLMCGRDVTTRSVIIRSKVCSDTTPTCGGQQPWQIDLTCVVND